MFVEIWGMKRQMWWSGMSSVEEKGKRVVA